MKTGEDDSWYTESDPVYTHDLEVVDWYTSFARGTWFGFYKGIYHDRKKPDSRCLSDSVHSEI